MKKNLIIKISILFLTLLSVCLLNACSHGGGGDDTGDGPAAGIPEIGNPIVQTQIFGENGNLYKPRSAEDSAGTGNLVVLLSPQFTTQFDSCEIRKSNGEIGQLICINDQPWTHVPFSCFSNGNRQTWRANFRCDEVAEVKVTCRDFQQEVIFAAPAGQTGSLCTRFG